MDDESLLELNDYFMKNLAINSSEIFGYQTVLKKDIMAAIEVQPPRYAYPILHPVKINQATAIKIIGPSGGKFLPFSNSNINYLLFEIVNPQADLGVLKVNLETLVEAIKPD